MARRAPDWQEQPVDASLAGRGPGPDAGRKAAAGGSDGAGHGTADGDGAAAPSRRRAWWRSAARDLGPVVVVVVVVGVPLAHIAWTAVSRPGAIWLGVDVPQMELRTLAASRGHLALGSFSCTAGSTPGPPSTTGTRRSTPPSAASPPG
jgi:hypothetical protein